MSTQHLTLILTALATVLAATGPGERAALLTAAFLCGVLAAAAAQRLP